jgi:NAD(P)-dependent dehydrogenase (short-subunit alcohol dehydrogenase family)
MSSEPIDHQGAARRLDGKAAVVTGGASGIGAVTARTLARHGAAVAIIDLDEERGDEIAATIRAGGGTAYQVAADIADESAVSAAFAEVADRLGGLDILVTCAALTDPVHQRRDVGVADLDLDVWQRTFSVDAVGVLLCCKAAIPRMQAAGGGSIINVSSNSALAGDLTLTAYAAAKAAVNSITRSVATAYGKQGVRCNTVSPGGVVSDSFTANVSAEVAALMLDQSLLPELGAPADVANLIVFLASDESRYITGQLINVDGGALSHLPHVGAMRAMRLTTASDSSEPT